MAIIASVMINSYLLLRPHEWMLDFMDMKELPDSFCFKLFYLVVANFIISFGFELIVARRLQLSSVLVFPDSLKEDQQQDEDTPVQEVTPDEKGRASQGALHRRKHLSSVIADKR